jgi:hypothetical protein
MYLTAFVVLSTLITGTITQQNTQARTVHPIALNPAPRSPTTERIATLTTQADPGTQPSQPISPPVPPQHQYQNAIRTRKDEPDRPPKKKCTIWQALIDWGNKKCYNGNEIADDLTGGNYSEIPI